MDGNNRKRGHIRPFEQGYNNTDCIKKPQLKTGADNHVKGYLAGPVLCIKKGVASRFLYAT